MSKSFRSYSTSVRKKKYFRTGIKKKRADILCQYDRNKFIITITCFHLTKTLVVKEEVIDSTCQNSTVDDMNIFFLYWRKGRYETNTIRTDEYQRVEKSHVILDHTQNGNILEHAPDPRPLHETSDTFGHTISLQYRSDTCLEARYFEEKSYAEFEAWDTISSVDFGFPSKYHRKSVDLKKSSRKWIWSNRFYGNIFQSLSRVNLRKLSITSLWTRKIKKLSRILVDSFFEIDLMSKVRLS